MEARTRGGPVAPRRRHGQALRPVARALALRVGQRSWAASTADGHRATGNDHCGSLAEPAEATLPACVARVWRRICIAYQPRHGACMIDYSALHCTTVNLSGHGTT